MPAAKAVVNKEGSSFIVRMMMPGEVKCADIWECDEITVDAATYEYLADRHILNTIEKRYRRVIDGDNSK